MALSWIRVDNDLPDHPKSLALDVALGTDRAWTHVVQLWLWASRVAPTGDLSKMPDAVIASRAGWKKDASVFVAALREVGFLDADGIIHDWHDHQGKMLERLEKDRERKRKPPKDSAGTPPELRRNSDGTPTEVQRASTGIPSLRYETVRDGTRRDETKNESAPPSADAAVADPVEPAQESLLPLPEKPPVLKDRKLSDEQQAANRWRERALEIAGIAPSEAGPWPKGIFHQWRREAQARGTETLMRSLEGVARMPPNEYVRKRGWVYWISGEGIDAGLAALGNGRIAAAPAKELRFYDNQPPPDTGPKWTPEGELERLAYLSAKKPDVAYQFTIPKGAALGTFDASRIPEKHLPIVNRNEAAQ